jgi:hypothetical protein
MNYNLREMETEVPILPQNTAELPTEHHGKLS